MSRYQIFRARPPFMNLVYSEIAIEGIQYSTSSNETLPMQSVARRGKPRYDIKA